MVEVERRDQKDIEEGERVEKKEIDMLKANDELIGVRIGEWKP